MAARLYPRINPPGPDFDPRTGQTATPLRVPADAGFSANTDVILSAATATTAQAASAVVVAGGAVPDVPGGLFAFHLEDASGPVHLRVAFISDPAAPAAAFAVPGDLRVALVPAERFSGGATVTLDGSMNAEAFRDMLLASDSTATKTVPGGYAQLSGDGLTSTGPTGGMVLPLTLEFTGAVPPEAVNATWYLVVKSTSPVWLTFAVTENPADTASVAELPWIHVADADADIDLGGPFAPGAATPAGTVMNVRNFGPGALNVLATNAPEPGGSDLVELTASVVSAANSGTIPLLYTADDGIADLVVPIASNDGDVPANDAYHNRELTVTATAESIGVADTVLVLDASGSMRLRPDGMGMGNSGSADPAQRRRWDNLVTAVNHLADGYISFLTDPTPGVGSSPSSKLGIAVFPDVLHKGAAGWPSRAATLLESTTVAAPELADQVTAVLENAGGEIEGAGLTPIGEGIAVAMGSAPGNSGMFDADAAAHRRWMVLMTDGAHNAGSINPNQFYLPDGVPDFQDKDVRVLSIAYTTANTGAAVDLMQELADHGLNPVDGAGQEESQFKQAATTAGFEKDLTDTFLDTMATTIGVDPSFDPPGMLSTESPVAIHEFQVSEYDTGVGIFVDWRTRNTDAVRVALISPRCERFEAPELEKRPEFRFRGLPAYAHVYISAAALTGDGKGPSRHGTWKLELRLGRGSDPSPGDSVEASVDALEPYKFNVFNRSALRMNARTLRSRHETGAPIEFVARLHAAGVPISNARVVARIDAPTADFGSQLAAFDVDADTMARAKKIASEAASETLGLWALKVQAMQLKLGNFEVSRVQREVRLEEVEAGVYRGVIENTPYAGVYSAHIVATGQNEDVAYRRERVLTANVEAKPDPAQTLTDFALGDEGQLTVCVRPRDALGNAVIFDPVNSARLGIDVRDAKPLSEVVNRFDGRYCRTFRVSGQGHPELVLSYDGEVFESTSAVPDPKTLCWVDKVFAYEPGEQVEDHRQPKNALGPVKGAKDPFVALGGGHIVLGVEHDRSQRWRNHFHASHISVFTPAQANTRYRVLVRPARHKRWISLGDGYGPTQVFAVSERLGPLYAVMIQDLDGCSKQGLQLQGVGYAFWRDHGHKEPKRQVQQVEIRHYHFRWPR